MLIKVEPIHGQKDKKKKNVVEGSEKSVFNIISLES